MLVVDKMIPIKTNAWLHQAIQSYDFSYQSYILNKHLHFALNLCLI